MVFVFSFKNYKITINYLSKLKKNKMACNCKPQYRKRHKQPLCNELKISIAFESVAPSFFKR